MRPCSIVVCICWVCAGCGTPTSYRDAQPDVDGVPSDGSHTDSDLDAELADGGSDAGTDTFADADADDSDDPISDAAQDSDGRDAAPLGEVYYVSLDGVDRDDCTGGTRENPWRTFNGSNRSGCIEPGDTVFFMQGTYVSDMRPFITFRGSEGLPVTVAADPEADSPVRFEGFFTVDGDWGRISGIEFYSSNSQENHGAILKINGSHITISHCLVDGTERRTPGQQFDCIKLLAGGTVADHTYDIEISDSEIHHCPEDAIDVTGSRDIRYRRNNMHHFGVIQIKGGTEDIIVEDNYIHDFEMGLRGAGMRCSNQYCGSPILPTIPVSDRFVARNVTIQNNIIVTNTGRDAISANGWQNVSIYHNTFYNIGNRLLILSHETGLDFYDDIANTYCTENPSRCARCEASVTCWRINFDAENVRFQNNIIDHAAEPIIDILNDRMESELISSHNIFDTRGSENVRFVIQGQSFSLAEFEPEEQSIVQDPSLLDPEGGDFHLSSDSPAIDRGTELGVSEDAEGTTRIGDPDIGALEYTP